MRNHHTTQPYGYNSFTIGTLVIYSAKIRVKADISVFDHMLNSMMLEDHPVIVTHHKNNCVAVSWTTTNYNVHTMYKELVDSILACIMHERIDAKYARKHEHTAVPIDIDELCF
jgi:hypothetical protein